MSIVETFWRVDDLTSLNGSGRVTDTSTAETVGGCFGASLVILKTILWIGVLAALIYWLVSNA